MATYQIEDLQETLAGEDGDLYHMPKQDETLRIIADIGNTDSKVMIHSHFGRELCMPQFVRKPNSVEYRNLSAGYKVRRSDFDDSAIFQMDGQGFIVGRHALQVGDGENRLGVDKYERDHIGAMLAGALLRLYPKGHPNIELVVLHPYGLSIENLKRLGKAVKGAFNITLPNGDKTSYTVSEVIPLEESIAAFQTFVLTTNGQTYKEPRFSLDPNKQFLIVDIGGWISSMAPGIVTRRGRLEINRSGAVPIQVGIQTVTQALSPLLKSKFPALDRLQEIPDSILFEAVMTNQISISGNDPVDCSDEVRYAMQPLIRALYNVYTVRPFSGGTPFNGIVVSGGGGAAAFHHLNERLFEHPKVYPAESNSDRMRYGAIRGASKGLIGALAKSGLLK